MQKKCGHLIISTALIVTLTGVTNVSAHASSFTNNEEQTYIVGVVSEENTDQELKAKPLFSTRYAVRYESIKTYSGPGLNYKVLHTLAKNDIVWVQSVSNGWAKSKINSEWNYIEINNLEKV